MEIPETKEVKHDYDSDLGMLSDGSFILRLHCRKCSSFVEVYSSYLGVLMEAESSDHGYCSAAVSVQVS
jgi:hypothetical protein